MSLKNFSAIDWLVASVERSMTFVFLKNFLFACPKRKLQRERAPRGGVGFSWFGVSENPCLVCAGCRHHGGRRGAAVIPDGLLCRQRGSAPLRLIIFLAGAAMIFFGVARGELQIIFNKASRVCLECIGLG